MLAVEDVNNGYFRKCKDLGSYYLHYLEICVHYLEICVSMALEHMLCWPGKDPNWQRTRSVHNYGTMSRGSDSLLGLGRFGLFLEPTCYIVYSAGSSQRPPHIVDCSIAAVNCECVHAARMLSVTHYMLC